MREIDRNLLAQQDWISLEWRQHLRQKRHQIHYLLVVTGAEAT